MSQPMKKDDPAYWMLWKGIRLEKEGISMDIDDTEPWLKDKPIHKDGCYICEDPEFRLMGLPLCQPCPVVVDGKVCGEHCAADDSVCDEGHDLQEWYEFTNYVEHEFDPDTPVPVPGGELVFCKTCHYLEEGHDAHAKEVQAKREGMQ
jgi:hypothetical protein